jgi:hypothetical protein
MSLSPFYNSTLKQLLLHSIPKMADVKIKVDKDKADIPRQEEHRVVGERYGMRRSFATVRFSLNVRRIGIPSRSWTRRTRLTSQTSIDTSRSRMMGTIADLLRWSTSSGLILTVSVCSLGAAVQGWDQTESNGASESLSKRYGDG